MGADAKVKHSELRQAVRDLQNRGLLHSARWAAEQLYGLEDETPGADDHDSGGGGGGGGAGATPVGGGAVKTEDDDDDAMDLGTPMGAGGGAKAGGFSANRGGDKPGGSCGAGGSGGGGGGGGDDGAAGAWRGRGGTAESAGDDFILAKAYFDLGGVTRCKFNPRVEPGLNPLGFSA